MPTYDNASGITCGCQQQKGTDLVKVWIARWVCDSMSVEAVSYQTSLAKLFTENRCELFCMMRLHSKVRCSKTPLPATCLTHAARTRMFRRLMILCSWDQILPNTDRMKITQNNKMSSKILPRTQRMLHCLCQVRGTQKPPGQYHGCSRIMTTRQQIRDGNHSGGPGSHCCLALLTNLVDT